MLYLTLLLVLCACCIVVQKSKRLHVVGSMSMQRVPWYGWAFIVAFATLWVVYALPQLFPA